MGDAMFNKKIVLALFCFVPLHLFGMHEDKDSQVTIASGNNIHFTNAAEVCVLSRIAKEVLESKPLFLEERVNTQDFRNHLSCKYLAKAARSVPQVCTTEQVTDSDKNFVFSPGCNLSACMPQPKVECASRKRSKRSVLVQVIPLNIQQYISKQIELKKRALTKKDLPTYKRFRKLGYIRQKEKIEQCESAIERLQKTCDDFLSHIKAIESEANVSISFAYLTEQAKQKIIARIYKNYAEAKSDLEVEQYKLERLKSFSTDAIIDQQLESFRSENQHAFEYLKEMLVKKELEKRSPGFENSQKSTKLSLEEKDKEIQSLEKQKSALDRKVQREEKKLLIAKNTYCSKNSLRETNKKILKTS